MKPCIPIKNQNSANIAGGMLSLALGVGVLVMLPFAAQAQVGRGFSGAGVGRSLGASVPAMTPSYFHPAYSPVQSFSRPSYTMPPVQSFQRPTYSLPSQRYISGGTGGASGITQNYNSQYQRNQSYQPSQRSSYYDNRAQSQGAVGAYSPLYHYTPSRPLTNVNSNTINNLVTSSSNNHYFNNSYHHQFGVPVNNRYYYGFGGLAFSPYYAPYFSLGYTALSPFAFYDGVYSPFITVGGLYNAPPQYTYSPAPVYQDGIYQGLRNEDVDSYYLNRNQNSTSPTTNNAGKSAPDNTYRIGEGGNGIAKDAALDTTVNDLRDAWKTGKIDPLAKHVRRDTKVAVYLRGKYQYSIDSGDYLDMTKDALQATKTVRFDIDTIQRKQKDVYVVLGRHIYQDAQGNEHTVHITYVLEKSDNDYVISQVGSAPDKIEEQP